MSWLDESDTDELCRRIQLFARYVSEPWMNLFIHDDVITLL